jgi:hypothetical protein
MNNPIIQVKNRIMSEGLCKILNRDNLSFLTTKCWHLLIFAICSILSFQSHAQRRIVVPEGYGTLNQAIDSDTVANGVRTNPNTVYILKRGGLYLLSGIIANRGFHLTLEAEDGTGPKPYILMGNLVGGVQVDQLFEVFGDLTLKAIHITSVNEGDAIRQRILRISQNDVRVTLTDCIFDRVGQAALRVEAQNTKVYLRSSVVSRIGLPNDPDNGRVVDNRGVTIDSLIIENNTIYNLTSTLYRPLGGFFNYCLVNQNTIVNSGQRLVDFGVFNPTSSAKLFFTNNIVVNARFQGNAASLIPEAGNVAIDFSLLPGNTATIQFRNNNFYYQPEVQQTWSENSFIQPDRNIPGNNSYFTSNISQAISFSGAIPVPPTEIIKKYALNQTTQAPYWDWTGAVQSFPWELIEMSYHNFAYPSSDPSYTASTSAEPLGDLRWHAGFEVPANLLDLVKRANAEVKRQEASEVVDNDPAKLAALQTAIANAQTLLQAASTNAQIGAGHAALNLALQEFKDSFIITDVEEDLTKKLRFYPNPASTYIYVPNPENNKIKSIRVLSLAGQALKQLNVGSSALLPVPVDDLPNGAYIVLFELANTQRVIQKLVKTNN